MRRRTRFSVLLAVFLLVLAVGPSALAARLAGTQASLLDAVNRTRSAHHLRPLALDPALGRAARAHTLDMLHGDYFSHGDFAGRMAAFHLAGALGENLAWGSGVDAEAQAVVQMWLASPPHRANLLSPGFRRIGLGVARGSFQGSLGATVVTADFGS